MFTRMTEIQVLNSVSFDKMFTVDAKLEWEIIRSETLTTDAIYDIKSKFGIGDTGIWTVRSIFGYKVVVQYDNQTGCLQFKLSDPDFGTMMCIPSRMVLGQAGNLKFEISVAVDDESTSVIYHLRISTYDTGCELFSKYIVLSNIE